MKHGGEVWRSRLGLRAMCRGRILSSGTLGSAKVLRRSLEGPRLSFQIIIQINLSFVVYLQGYCAASTGVFAKSVNYLLSLLECCLSGVMNCIFSPMEVKYNNHARESVSSSHWRQLCGGDREKNGTKRGTSVYDTGRSSKSSIPWWS